MAYRPYFKFGIEQLQDLFASSQGDLKTLKSIQHELSFRNRPKSRALKSEVDTLVRQLSVGEPVASYSLRSQSQPMTTRFPESFTEPQRTPDRVVIECANCKTPNFVSTLEGVVQHLSCSACKSPYEAQFKYGVMRTTFQTIPVADPNGFSMKWIVVGLAFVIILAILIK